VDREREPSGDYGYDLAHDDMADDGRPHEESGGSQPHEDLPAPEHPQPAPAHPDQLSGDYGYDEAHGF
jgi:hypothetical protein